MGCVAYFTMDQDIRNGILQEGISIKDETTEDLSNEANRNNTAKRNMSIAVWAFFSNVVLCQSSIKGHLPS